MEGTAGATGICALHRTGDGLIFTGHSEIDFNSTAGLSQSLAAPQSNPDDL